MIRIALSLAAVLALAGCGASKDPKTSIAYISVTETVIDEAPPVTDDTVTVTVIAKAPKAATPKPKPKPKPKPPKKAPKPRSLKFSGNGTQALRPFTLARGGTLYWSCTCALSEDIGGYFSMQEQDIFADNALTVSSGLSTEPINGSSFIESGRHALEVAATGEWSIEIVQD